MSHCCNNCKRDGTAINNPLLKCIKCTKHYHAACHRPKPTSRTNWTCHLCISKWTKYYADRSFTASQKPDSLNSCQPSSSSSSMALAYSSASITSEITDSAQPKPKPKTKPHASCLYPRCEEAIGLGLTMCQSHSRETLTIPINGSRATWGSEMGSSAARPSQSAPNPSKRLSESDKNCPQVIRKSVQKSQFMHQNMTSHVVGQPASPTSPMLAHPRLSAHSPPDTPVRLRGGDSPMKKKIKLSDSPTDAPEYRPNGIEPLGNGRGKAVKSQTAQSSGHPPNGSLRRTAKPLPHGNKRLEKTKLGAVRKMASAVPLAALNGLARVHFTDGQPGKESGDDADILVCENKDAISDHQLYGRRIGEQHALLKHTPNGHASSREPSWPKTFAMQEEEPQPSREARVVDEAVFDNMVYSQERAIQRPPPEVKPLCIKPKPDPTSEAKFIDINPVVHYNQLRSEKWYEDKLAEIQERGGRKTRFGRAAERMREQRLKEGPQPIERTIPWQILENEKWMKARARLEALLPEKSVKQPDRTKQVRQGLKPGPKLGHKKPGPKPGQKRQQKLANMVPSNP